MGTIILISRRVRRSRLANLVFLIFIFWFVSNAVSWVFSVGGPPPILSYYAFLGFAGWIIIVRTSQGQPFIRREQWRKTQAFLIWIFAFVFWVICNYLYSSQSMIATQWLITRLEMAAVMVGFLLLLGYELEPRALGKTLALLVALSVFLNVYDFFAPTFSGVPGRAAGLYVNPNISGFMAVLMMTTAISFMRLPMHWLVLASGSLGIFLTFSRGAWAVLFLTITWLFMKGHLGMRRQRGFVGLMAITAVGAFGYSIISGSLAEFILDSPLQVYLDANTLVRLGLGQFATDFSADERAAVAKLAIDMFLNAPNPLLGYGLGYTHEWDFTVSTHNMYLLFLVEGGIVGLMIYLSLFVVLWWRATAFERLIQIQIMLYGLFSHNILDSPGRVFFVALLGSRLISTQADAYGGELDHGQIV